jgi:CubicO group peptidase (beta-lactamase class C family)
MWAAPVVTSAARPASQTGLAQIERRLEIVRPDTRIREVLDLRDALRALKVPSVSIALINGDRIAWAGAYGEASARTLYQAASLSKVATAVAALRLVQQGRLDLDRNVNAELASWHIPRTALTRRHPVTLRGLLSMTAGINVPGYVGYLPGSALPNLRQILEGKPPSNSPAVRVERVPGSGYAYSGGGYEIVQALIENAAHQPFADAMEDLVLRPAGMADSFFGQPPLDRQDELAPGHRPTGVELPGGWRVIPELAAGGMWSTPTDLARLLIAISRAYKGEASELLDLKLAREMLRQQNGGPYGLGSALGGLGRSLVLMKRGQNIGYQGYMLIFPETGQGMVVMTGSDNGTALATAIIRRAATAFHWPPLGQLLD